MLKVLRDDSTGEMEISGTRSELFGLGLKLRSGQGKIRLSEVSNPFPYSRAFSRIDFQQAGGQLRLSASEDGEASEVRGGLASAFHGNWCDT